MLRYLLDTDQRLCYDKDGWPITCEKSGQDASHHSKHLSQPQPRFQVTGRVVKDNVTDTTWHKDANPAQFPLTWEEAIAFVADMRRRRRHGLGDWQLPSRRHLFSLISHQNINPVLPCNHPFDGVFPGYYWTADSCFRLPDQAWYVHLGGGRVHRGMKHGSYMVWPISLGSQHSADPCIKNTSPFIADGNCVLDRRTGLTWSKNANPADRPLTWQQALSMVTALNRDHFGGYRNWRMPNIRELESLVDLCTHSPALPDGHPFIHVQAAYWSSTTSVYEPCYAWSLYSQDGIVGVGFKPGDDYFFLWPVRSG